MIFYISDIFSGGTGQRFFDKESFLKELSLMIDDCIKNGGTAFDVEVDTDASCFS